MLDEIPDYAPKYPFPGGNTASSFDEPLYPLGNSVDDMKPSASPWTAQQTPSQLDQIMAMLASLIADNRRIMYRLDQMDAERQPERPCPCTYVIGGQ